VIGRHQQIASAPPPRSALHLRRPRKIPFDDIRGNRAAGTVAHARSGDAGRLCGRRGRSTVLGRHHQIVSALRSATEERAPPPQAAQGNWRSTRESSGRWTERCRLGRAKVHCSPPYPGRTSPAGRSGPGAPRSRSAAARLHPALAACSRGVSERNAWSVLAERGRPNNPSAMMSRFSRQY
jgi:hypothetical protein